MGVNSRNFCGSLLSNSYIFIFIYTTLSQRCITATNHTAFIYIIHKSQKMQLFVRQLLLTLNKNLNRPHASDHNLCPAWCRNSSYKWLLSLRYDTLPPVVQINDWCNISMISARYLTVLLVSLYRSTFLWDHVILLNRGAFYRLICRINITFNIYICTLTISCESWY